MHRQRSHFERATAPAVLLGLAVSAPLALALAAEPATAGCKTRPTATLSSHDRADALLRCVSEAARQLCGCDAALAETDRPAIDRHTVAEPAASEHHDHRPLSFACALPCLIDLPPPTL